MSGPEIKKFTCIPYEARRLLAAVAKIGWCQILLLAVCSYGALAAENISTTRAVTTISKAGVVPTPAMSMPAYLKPVIDPAFGTPFTRVTDPGRELLPGVKCGAAYCTHRYSSSQAWNADQSLLVIDNGCSGFCFLDGRTYKPLFQRSVSGECEWHPTDPKRMICVYGRELYLWSPQTNVKTVVYAPSGYKDMQFGPYKGNPSKDGRRVVIRATNTSGTQVAFAYDISTKTKFPDITLAKLAGRNSYCGISPSGRYVFCFQEMPDGTNRSYVLNPNGAVVQYWTENHRPGHGDMTTDADGSDIYVGISKASPDAYHIIKRRLTDGKVTVLAPYGNGQHVSIRNISRPGWVFVTYSGTYSEVASHPKWAPFYQEVIALRIDGSGEIRRIAQTRNAKADYWSETHGSPSRDGSRVIWSSNWGKAGGPVSDYVSTLAWP